MRSVVRDACICEGVLLASWKVYRGSCAQKECKSQLQHVCVCRLRALGRFYCNGCEITSLHYELKGGAEKGGVGKVEFICVCCVHCCRQVLSSPVAGGWLVCSQQRDVLL